MSDKGLLGQITEELAETAKSAAKTIANTPLQVTKQAIGQVTGLDVSKKEEIKEKDAQKLARVRQLLHQQIQEIGKPSPRTQNEDSSTQTGQSQVRLGQNPAESGQSQAENQKSDFGQLGKKQSIPPLQTGTKETKIRIGG